MTPLPAAFGDSRLLAWRLDRTEFASSWDSGEGAYRFGGRWNSKGIRAVYCSVDPATAILEVAVHKGFKALDTVPHILTAMLIDDPAEVHLVDPASIPNANWLHPGVPSAGQQGFGDRLLARHRFILLPSTVSTHSWNLIFARNASSGAFRVETQEAFALDTRLHPPAA